MRMTSSPASAAELHLRWCAAPIWVYWPRSDEPAPLAVVIVPPDAGREVPPVPGHVVLTAPAANASEAAATLAWAADHAGELGANANSPIGLTGLGTGNLIAAQITRLLVGSTWPVIQPFKLKGAAMPAIIAGLNISLDGVVESPQAWQFDSFDAEMGAEIGRHLAAADALLLGRRTYEEFSAYWPTAASADDPMAARMNSIRKMVASTTLRPELAWPGAELITGDLAATLRADHANTVQVVGSPTLVRWLLDHGLLDELALFVHPVVVGRGARLFPDAGPRRRLKLVDSTTYGTGTASLTYRPTTR